MPKVTGLGHVGIYVKDMPTMVEFYNKFLGLQITDRGDDDWIVFLSANPEAEHHEFALAKPRNGEVTQNVQQISFRVGSLTDLKEFYRNIKDRGYKIDHVTNHVNAIGCYFFDPEENRVEVYWQTGKEYPQPQGGNIDLELSEHELMSMIDNAPPKERKVSAN
jgi:catechol-2,3-dioxygenase